MCHILPKCHNNLLGVMFGIRRYSSIFFRVNRFIVLSSFFQVLLNVNKAEFSLFERATVTNHVSYVL